MQKATLGAGCFWIVEEAFRHLPGVEFTQVGYMGGHTKNPTYYDLLTGASGHAEVVEITYDPFKISYEALLEVFWKCHDPTLLNRQDGYSGTQYRSVIFFHSPDEEQKALKSMKDLEEQGLYQDPIVTEILLAQTFWRAEEHHQKFVAKRALYLKTIRHKPSPKRRQT